MIDDSFAKKKKKKEEEEKYVTVESGLDVFFYASKRGIKIARRGSEK